jgi:hypothetical protein
MKQLLLILGVLAAALPQLIASSENAAIVTEAERFLIENATARTKINFTVEKIEGDFARVRINPKDAPGGPAWIFLQKKAGKWRGLTVRAAFSAEHYQQFDIPKSLQLE